uniref:PNPLA domain-containing protein n=1 Tax=candidate division WOR-3 bacterium TaxID=2052148 RepID=A0A7C3J6Y1_UNCW3
MGFPVYRKRKPVIGLALGSGAAKGYAHIGVLKVLEELKIKPDIITGTSMGALIGALYASGYLAKDIDELANKIDKKEMRKLFKITFDGAGLVNGELLNKYIDSLLPVETFNKLKIPFGCVACNIIDGREFNFTKGFLRDALRASISIPGIITPKVLKNYALVDGGLVNPVPVSLCRKLGADIVIAVNVLHTPILKCKCTDFPVIERIENYDSNKDEKVKNFNEKIKLMLKQEIEVLENKAKIIGSLLNLNDKLNIMDVISQTFMIAESNLANFRLSFDKPDFLIQPDMSSIKHFDFYKSEEAILLGEKEMWKFAAESKISDRLKNYEPVKRFLHR